MSEKKLPFSKEHLERILAEYPTPFHIYDEKGIRDNARKLKSAFSWSKGYINFFAVKAAPNPTLLSILREEGFGADCSSFAELVLAEKAGFHGEEIIFTSNDTPADEFIKAKELGAIINLDDITHIEFLHKHTGIPELICFRYNPGPLRSGNSIIGNPEEAKYGFTREQLFEGYKLAASLGAKRFGLHTMIASNELDYKYFVETARMLMEIAVELNQRLGISLEFINLGGGIGIPYRPEQSGVDLFQLGEEIELLYRKFIDGNNLAPLKIYTENGRMVTGPFGYLVSRVLHRKHTYKEYVGLDACMANLMRPALYGAYHHITVVGKEDFPLDRVYDVTGSLCENNDKFAIDRKLPEISVGDVIVIHDAGAHGHAMGFNYNGKLRSAELLFKEDGSVKLIRRAETLDDLFATLDFNRIK